MPIVLLPITVVARFQEPSPPCRAGGALAGPAPLVSWRVGVRAHGQTRCVWLRGILTGLHGVAAPDMRRVTSEPALVAAYTGAAAARTFHATYGFKPVNHVAVTATTLAATHPDRVAELTALLPAGGPDLDRAIPAMRRFLQDQWMPPSTGAQHWCPALARIRIDPAQAG